MLVVFVIAILATMTSSTASASITRAPRARLPSATHPHGFTESYAYLRKYVEASGVAKKGACHLFRHTMATLMLEGGADVRYVQEMLGHAKLETTQLYTQVSIHKLREIHAATHPGARLRPRAEARLAKTSPAPSGDECDARAAATSELLSSFAAEAAEEVADEA